MLENLPEKVFSREFLAGGVLPFILLLCVYYAVYLILYRLQKAKKLKDYWFRTWRHLSWFFYLFALSQPIAVLFPQFTASLRHFGEIFTKPLLGKEGSPSLLALLALLPVFIISSRLASACAKLLGLYFEGSKKLDKRTDRRNVKALLSLSQYIFVLVFCLFGINLIGINLSSLVVLLGGLGLGIGFGLQNIAGNFVSGVTLLITGHIQYGDFIRTKSHFGSVERIGLLSTVLLTTEYENLVIPNQYLLNDVIENTSYNNNHVVQLHLPLGVSYESDLNLVVQLIQELLLKNPYIPSPEQLRNFAFEIRQGNKKSQAPTVIQASQASEASQSSQSSESSPSTESVNTDVSLSFTPGSGIYNDIWLKGFGSSSIDFEVRLMIDGITVYREATHWFYMHAWQCFKDNGITIPFPQMDLHFPGENKGPKGPSVAGFGAGSETVPKSFRPIPKNSQ